MTAISESPVGRRNKCPLEGRVALVTGGTRGIGAAISRRLAAGRRRTSPPDTGCDTEAAQRSSSRT